MVTDRELLRLASRLADASQMVVNATPATLSERIMRMEIALFEYDNALREFIIERRMKEECLAC